MCTNVGHGTTHIFKSFFYFHLSFDKVTYNGLIKTIYLA